MQNRLFENPEAVFITLDQGRKISNLGRNKVRELAREANAVVKIGKCYRIDRAKFLEHIIMKYGE